MNVKELAVALCIAAATFVRPQDVGAAAAPGPGAAPAANEARDSKSDAAGEETGFSKFLELQGINFRIDADAGNLKITPAGLQTSNEPIVRAVEGQVTGAEVGDLDADGSPEVYVFLRAGDDARGKLVAYSTNKRKSMSEIYLAPIEDDAVNGKGYRGHDEFAVLENRIGQRFPIVGEDGRASGKTRQLQYRLVPGEAGWRLVLDRAVEF